MRQPPSGEHRDHPRRSSLIGWSWLAYVFVNMRRAQAEVGSEIELAPNRKPYYDDEQLEGPQLERVQLLGLLAAGRHRHRPAAVLAARAGPPGRRRRRASTQTFVEWGARAVRHHRRGRLQLRRLPRRHEGHRRRRAVHASPTRRPARSRPVNWKAPALNTVLLPLQPRTRSRYILTYGRPFSPMPAVGLAGGGPLNDQQIETPHRLPAVDPAAAGAVRQRRDRLRGRHLPSRSRTRSKAIDAALADGSAKSDGEALFNLHASTRRLLLRPLPHQRAGPTATRVVSGGGALGPNLTGGADGAPVPERGRPRSTSSRPAPRRASGTASRARARAACRASARCYTARADRGHRRVRAEPVMSSLRSHCSPSLGARDPRHPRRRSSRVVVLMRQRLPHPRHQPRRPPRLPGRARRAVFGWLAADGHRSGGSTASACKGPTRRGSRRSSVIGDRASATRARPRRPDGSTTSRTATPTQPVDGWSQLAERRSRRSARRSAAADDILAEPGRGVQGRATTVPIDVYDKGGERLPEARRQLDFFAFLHRPALRRRRRCSRSIPHDHRARAAPRRRPSSTDDPAAASTCCMDARPRHPAPAGRALITRRRALIFFAIVLLLLHRRDTASPMAERVAAQSPERVGPRG